MSFGREWGYSCPWIGSSFGSNDRNYDEIFPCSLIVKAAMPDAKSTVLVIDDDPDLRASIGRLLRSLDLEARLFASVSDFLKSDLPDGPACLVLDVRLPGQSGLDFQRELAGANTNSRSSSLRGMATSR